MTLARFPRRTLPGHRCVHRIHRSDRDPWWFSDDGSGRFDPVGSGQGTCYLAETPLGAWVEVFRKQMLWAESELRDRLLMSVKLERTLHLVDLTSRRALAFGVTASLGSDQDYCDSQRFARDALQAGFDGIRYLVCHDPGQRLRGIALFYEAGAPAETDPKWPLIGSDSIPDTLIEEAERVFGYRVLPSP